MQRDPIIHELAQSERRSRLTPTAQQLHRREQPAERERSYGCRRATELGEQLAYAVPLAASPCRSAMVAVLIWALELRPWPLGFLAESSTENSARRLRAAASEDETGSHLPAEFLRGVAETSQRLLSPHAAPPQPSSPAAVEASQAPGAAHLTDCFARSRRFRC